MLIKKKVDSYKTKNKKASNLTSSYCRLFYNHNITVFHQSREKAEDLLPCPQTPTSKNLIIKIIIIHNEITINKLQKNELKTTFQTTTFMFQ